MVLDKLHGNFYFKELNIGQIKDILHLESVHDVFLATLKNLWESIYPLWATLPVTNQARLQNS